MSIVSAAVVAFLYGAGCYLLLQRALTRIVLGLALLGHGAVLLLLLAAGPPGEAPFPNAGSDPQRFSDPLPQALALTAIVITFAVLVLLLALAYRSWSLSGDDEVEDDLEDARILEPHRADRLRRDLEALETDLEDR
ncbi:MAG: NADH-quinone oxidoreductase subunit K [Acidimicrobiales bacterium]